MSDEAGSSEVGTRISLVVRELLRSSPDEIILRLNELRDELIRIDERDSNKIEIDRRVCEAKLSLLYNKKCSIQQWDEIWSQMKSIGFSDYERKASMFFYNVKFALSSNATKNYKDRALEDMHSVIGELRSKDHGMSKHFEAALEMLTD